MVFSVLVNNFTCSTDDTKAAVDRFVDALARHAGWADAAPAASPATARGR